MARILAIDYGLKRVGIATTDPLQIIASPLETVKEHELLTFLKSYLAREKVETIVVGLPKNLQNKDTDSTQAVRKVVQKIKNLFPHILVELEDERFTSKIALNAMLVGGMKKSERRKKENVDKISAAVILQSYLNRKSLQQ